MTLRRHIPATAEAPTRREALVRPNPPPRALVLRPAPEPDEPDEVDDDEVSAEGDEVDEVPLRPAPVRSAQGLVRSAGSLARPAQPAAPEPAPIGSPFEPHGPRGRVAASDEAWHDEDDDEDAPVAKRRLPVPLPVIILAGMVAVILVVKIATRSHGPTPVAGLVAATLGPLELPAKPSIEVAPPVVAAPTPEPAVAAAAPAAIAPTAPAPHAPPVAGGRAESFAAAAGLPEAAKPKAKPDAPDDGREPTLGELIGGEGKPAAPAKPEPKRGPKSLRDVLEPSAAEPEPEPEPAAEPDEPQAVAEVVTRIISEPKAATVRVNGRIIGTTPTQVEWTTDRRPLVEVLLPDYAPVSMKLGTSDANKALYVALVRSAKVKVPAGETEGP